MQIAERTSVNYCGPATTIYYCKNLFWPFGSFKNAILLSLSDPSSAGNFAQSWKTFSTITICNIKSIQQTKLEKMA